eukprot:scaffold132863_cov39-Tisochrysis_lutea.AAC.1
MSLVKKGDSGHYEPKMERGEGGCGCGGKSMWAWSGFSLESVGRFHPLVQLSLHQFESSPHAWAW